MHLAQALFQNRRPIRAYQVAYAQGWFYLLTGLWPLVHMGSFEAVTGPKVDRWLVQTVGAEVAVIGAVLTLAGRRRATGPEIRLLGAGSAVALAAVDVIFVARGRISPVYLLDALAELALTIAWAASPEDE